MNSDEDLHLAHHMADLAAKISLRYLNLGDLRPQNKQDGSPVTSADHRIERELRALIDRMRPQDAFTGEELGTSGGGPRRWFVDAIDGTRSYLAGTPEWGTLIGLTHEGSAGLGLVCAPVLQRRWWAVSGHGAWTCGPPGVPHRVSVTGQNRLCRASVGIWPPPQRMPEGHCRTAAARIAAQAANTVPALEATGRASTVSDPPKPSTGSGTCHGGLLVATGQLDAFLLVGGGPWDVAPLVPIVREAWGAFTDLDGRDRFDTGTALFSNARIHDELLDAVRTAT